jgi:hypothetical protein
LFLLLKIRSWAEGGGRYGRGRGEEEEEEEEEE